MNPENQPPTPGPAPRIPEPDPADEPSRSDAANPGLPASPPARPRLGGPEIYLSWEGEVYGPSTIGEVMAGLRSSFFEPGTVFWFEGQDAWRPVAEFPALFDNDVEAEPTELPLPANLQPLRSPSRPSSRSSRSSRKNRGQGRKGSPRRGSRGSHLGRWIIPAFVLLAVALTVGILLLLMFF